MKRVQRHRPVEPDSPRLTRVETRKTDDPRRAAVGLLQEEVARGIRPPHLADVRKREEEDDGENEEQTPQRHQDVSDETLELLAVRDESEQDEREDPRQEEPGAVSRPAEGREPRRETNRQRRDYHDENDRRTHVDVSA